MIVDRALTVDPAHVTVNPAHVTVDSAHATVDRALTFDPAAGGAVDGDAKM